jgi:hypothetical protein
VPSELLKILENTISLLETFLKIPTAKRIYKSAPKYVLPKESVIVRLWEEFAQGYFSKEQLTTWKERWIDDPLPMPGIIIEGRFASNNSRHLLLTILKESSPLKLDCNMDEYVERRWGLKQYSSNASRYVNHKKEHYELKKVREILKSE